MECAVCYEVCKGPKRLLCGHTFCTGCIKEWYLKSEEPACPMCRGPLCFRGFLSSGWRQEKEKRIVDDFDVIVQRVVDTLIENRFEEFEDEDITPDVYDLEELMYDLSDVQTTMNAMYHIYEIDPETIEYTMFSNFVYISLNGKTIIDWGNEPPKPFFTRYPEIV